MLDPMHILLYAILPYEVRGIDVTPAEPRVKPGTSVTVRLSVQASGELGAHFLRLTVEAPDGTTRPGFARTVQAANGRAETTLRFALNDPAGEWQLTARDTETGVSGSTTVEVAE